MADQPEGSLATLWLGLVDERRPARDLPLSALSELDADGLRRLREAWKDVSPPRRREVVDLLVASAQDRVELGFAGIFRWLLDDEDEQVRIQALEGLWEEEDLGLIGPFLRLLRQDPVTTVRAAAALSLGRFVLLGELDEIDQRQARAVEQALVETFTSGEAELEVRRRALEALAYSGRQQVQRFILAGYQDDDDAMRRSAVLSMGRNADPRWGGYVLGELDSPDDAMRLEAIQASGELELAEAVPDLLDFLADEDLEMRDAAVLALGRIGGPAARRALQACCESDDPDLRLVAEDALDELEFMAGGDDMPAFMFDFE